MHRLGDTKKIGGAGIMIKAEQSNAQFLKGSSYLHLGCSGAVEKITWALVTKSGLDQFHGSVPSAYSQEDKSHS